MKRAERFPRSLSPELLSPVLALALLRAWREESNLIGWSTGLECYLGGGCQGKAKLLRARFLAGETTKIHLPTATVRTAFDRLKRYRSAPILAAVRKAEPGCMAYRPHRSTTDPDLFIFYEQYKDAAAFDAHRKSPHLAAYRERRESEGLVEGATEVEIYRSITD